MFGHDNQHHHDENNLPEPDSAVVGDSTTTMPDDTGTDAYMDDVPAATPAITPAPADDAVVAAPEEAADLVPAPADDATASTPAVSEPAATPVIAPAEPNVPAPDTDKLLDIKQQALQQLTPLVGHLEQSPEEKFRTTMMMIQASDNHELVGAAYEAAQQIPDEKVRAQALLDIVNEINYFTHNGTEA